MYLYAIKRKASTAFALLFIAIVIAKYCDESVCLSVCLHVCPVRPGLSRKLQCSNFINFLCMLPMAVERFFCDDSLVCGILSTSWLISCHIMAFVNRNIDVGAVLQQVVINFQRICLSGLFHFVVVVYRCIELPIRTKSIFYDGLVLSYLIYISVNFTSCKIT